MSASWADQKSENSVFWSVIFSYSVKNELVFTDCDVWWKVDYIQLAMISSMVRLRRSSKALPKAKLAPKNGHGHSLVVCSLSDPLQLFESQRSHYICELCSANQWDAPKTAGPATSIGQQKGPNSSPWQCLTAYHTTNASEVEWMVPWSFASPAIFTWLLTDRLSLPQASQQLFVGKRLPQPAGYRKCFPRVHQIQSTDFYPTGVNTSHWQTCVDCNGSYFD